MRRRVLSVGLLMLAAGLAVLVFPNARSLYEGLFFYLPNALAYNPTAVQPLGASSRYSSVFDLIRMKNAERYNYLLAHLDLPNVSVTRVPVSGAALPNLFVHFNNPGPYTVFSAHYDKLHDDSNYQGASDNTAAVAVLVASATDLASRQYAGSAAFLFTSEEETGLRGSTAFMQYARANSLSIRENVNFDNIGRGKLAIRPSVEVPGFVFTVPFAGNYTYDGRKLQASHAFGPANARLTQALLQIQPDIVVYERFSAKSDSNVFQAHGIDTVAISGDDMYYLEQTWHTFDDRVELLDERNLDLAFNLIIGFALLRS